MIPTYLEPNRITAPLDDYTTLMDKIDRKESEQARWLGKFLLDTLRPQSVIDWGCASGLYLCPFAERGAQICGIDGEINGGSQLGLDNFYCMDIRVPIQTDHYDLALCIETAEHLQEEYADTLVDNVTRSADVVFWSAATVGQGGRNHYNMQLVGYWANKFALRGFVLHSLNREIIAEIGDSDKSVAWLRKNARLWGKYA